MTAAKVMDAIARLPGCDGQAADAISAYTQVKMGDAPTLLRIPKSECPDTWIRLPRHNWPKSWSILWFLVNEIYTDIHLLVSYGKDSLRKLKWNLDGKKCRFGNVCLLIENKDYSYRYSWMKSNWLESSSKWLPCGRN